MTRKALSIVAVAIASIFAFSSLAHANVASKARVLEAAIIAEVNGQYLPKGVATIKIGKAGKSGVFSIAGTIRLRDGNSYTIKKAKATENGGNVTVNDIGLKNSSAKLSILLRPNDFFAILSNGWYVVPATISHMNSGNLNFTITAANSTNIDGLPILIDYLPRTVSITSNGKKFKTPKAGKVVCKSGTCMATSTANPSGLKLTYSKSKGTFKGSFNLYTYNAATNKLIKKKASVTGVTYDNVGYAYLRVPGAGIWGTAIIR